jgi:hypothetical protein
MRLLSLLGIGLIVCLVAITLPPAPTEADSLGPSIWLSPTHGRPGEDVTVYGDNFTADEWVDIYYDGEWMDDVKADEEGDFSGVTFTVPEGYSGDHEVRAEDVYDRYAYAYFTIRPILTIDPEEGAVGTMVTVEGHGFAEDEENIELMYYPDGDPEIIEDDISADEDGYWERSFEIPPSPQGHHIIDAEGDESRLHEVKQTDFEVIPTISIDEPSGSVGDEVTMTANGFYANDRYIKILVGGEEAKTEPEIIRADENGNWEAIFEVPQMPAGEYSVTAEGESTRKEDISALTFQIGPGLALSPDEGHVGTNLTVTGGGFDTDDYVDVMYDGNEIDTVKTDDEGSFEVTFPVPESRHGAREVTADVDGQLKASAIFVMESEAPDTPEPIAPPDGSRIGFIGKVRPTFEWSEVSDVSGVYYSLQIATSNNVTATGEFVDPVVSVTGLVATNYTLDRTEALPYGTYYWIIQSVDGAENESGWTTARSLRVGALPLWAFILIIVAAVAGIGTAVYFFIFRKRIYYY